MKGIPYTRMRRNRKAEWSRKLVAENTITPADLILPIFIKEGKEIKEEIKTMPGVFRNSPDEALKLAQEAHKLGIPAIALFPCIDAKLKDEMGKEALNPENLVCRTIKLIKSKVPDIGIISDVALDPYTTHGHDGLLGPDFDVMNDETVEVLCKQAGILAQAGADMVAPSDMMDGRVLAIRSALEDGGFYNTQILSYSAKYASCLYSPFRDSVDSKAKLKGNKKTYQMDVANSNEALLEVELDITEGADIVMVKPGLPYLDVIRRVKDKFQLPIFAFQVSGEYSMIKFAAQNGVLDEKSAFIETIIAFKRAGCSAVLTYAALEIAAGL